MQWWAEVGRREEYELTHINPPIPTRSHDWRATRKGREEPAGYGPTQEAAIENLKEQEQ